jgi:DNA mismatch repair protein MutS
MEEGKGQDLMVEFNGDEPTYRIIPGISRVSHAERVAERIHFSKEDRRRYLEEKGYL